VEASSRSVPDLYECANVLLPTSNSFAFGGGRIRNGPDRVKTAMSGLTGWTRLLFGDGLCRHRVDYGRTGIRRRGIGNFSEMKIESSACICRWFACCSWIACFAHQDKNGIFILLIFISLIAYAAWRMGRKGSRLRTPPPRPVLSGVLVLAFVRWLSIFSQRAVSRPVNRDSKSTRAARSLAACQSAGRRLKSRSESHTKNTRRKDHLGVGEGKY